MRLLAEAKLAGATLPAGGVLALVSQTARAVGYAHGRGLTHLGLSPTNIIVTADGDVRVTDFGILAATMPARPVETGRLANRIGYLAPEQLEGEGTSAATDVYVLGVIAYELITGLRAFPGESPHQIAQAILNGPPPDPAHAAADRARAPALRRALAVRAIPGCARARRCARRGVARRPGSRHAQRHRNTGQIDDRSPRGASRQSAVGHGVALHVRDRADPAHRSRARGGAAATIPDLPKPFNTVAGVAPPPIPVPPGVSSPPMTPPLPQADVPATIIGIGASIKKPQIPTINPVTPAKPSAVKSPPPTPTVPQPRADSEVATIVDSGSGGATVRVSDMIDDRAPSRSEIDLDQSFTLVPERDIQTQQISPLLAGRLENAARLPTIEVPSMVRGDVRDDDEEEE